MAHMTVITPEQHGGPFTVADLEAMPDDGRRYELLDGALLVTPSPVPRHQGVAARLSYELMSACPDGLKVFFAPLDVTLADDTVLQPDILVVRKSDVGEKQLTGVPVLAVEVLSPSTRSIDLGAKLERYQRAGCPSYWVVDPDTPSLTAWQLQEGAYGDPLTVAGSRSFTTDSPFAVEIVPARLLD